MTGKIYWNNEPVSYKRGETIAAVLERAGILKICTSPTGQTRSLFCGIGLCQSCLVWNEKLGEIEACLFVCKNGMRLFSHRPGYEECGVANE